MFSGWLNLFIDPIRIDGPLELLTHDYFEEMVWAGNKAPAKAWPTRAQMLKSAFIGRTKPMIQSRRKALTGVVPDDD